MKFLIAGYGSIGRRHLRNLQTLGQHDLLLLRSHRSTLPEEEIKDIPVETTIADALAHQPDGVIIANPSAMHLDIAIPAAEAGCAILMEKPISDISPKLDLLQKIVAGHPNRFLMGFQYRFHPGLLRVRALLEQGKIGRPLSFQATWGEYLPDWHPWEDYRKSYSARADLGGGVALTLCHPLDYARWLFGEAASIWGISSKTSDLEIEVDDLAEINLCMRNGMTGNVHLDYYRRFVRHDLEVVGTAGVIHWNNADALVTLQTVEQPECVTLAPEIPFDRNDLFLAEMKHFIAICAGETVPFCTFEDGLKVDQMVAALKQSSAEGRQIHLD